MFSSPSEKLIPSSEVGDDLKVLSTEFASIPFSNGVYFFGSNVSVCAMPPAIQRRITVSAVDLIFGFEQDVTRLVGIPAAKAARVAALVFCRNSRLFQDLFIVTQVSYFS
jgi:hypothetical protein